MITAVEFFGILSVVLTTISWLPQLLKAWKTKSVEDISWLMLILYAVGISSWAIYGWLTTDWPIIITEILVLFQTFLLAYFKVRYRK
jgi:MtN3 and saliva related transmembrane protein